MDFVLFVVGVFVCFNTSCFFFFFFFFLQITELIIESYDELFGEIGLEDGKKQEEMVQKLSSKPPPQRLFSFSPYSFPFFLLNIFSSLL